MIAAWPRGRQRRIPRLSAAWYQANESRRIFWFSTVSVLAAILLGQAVLAIGGAAVVIPAGLAVLAAIVWQPKLGLYTVFALVLLFEMGSADPLMLPGRYFNYGLQSSLGVSGFIASPLELLLILSWFVWFVQGVVRHTLTYRGGDLGWPVALFFLAILGGLLRGAAGQGDMYVAFWEARSLLYLGVCYMLAVNLVRTRRDVAVLLVVFLVANGLYALEGAYRHIVLIRTGLLGVAPEFNYTHEVVIFLSVLLLQALVLVVVGGPRWMQALGLLLAPIGLYTLLATQRRAGYIALALAFAVMAMPWLVRHRKAILFIALPAAVVTAVYLPLFWNNTGLLGQPARAVRSMIAPDARDASSNDYRALERINVRETIRTDPLLGVGFGRPFQFVVPLPDLSWWPFWHYQPHHNVLWVWLKTGALGFTIFWVLMLGALALAASRALTLADPTLTSFAYLAIASIVASLIFCYVDLGLTNGRVTVFLGMVLGVLAGLRQIDLTTPAGRTAAEAEYEAAAAKVAAKAAQAARDRQRRRMGYEAGWSDRWAGADLDVDLLVQRGAGAAGSRASRPREPAVGVGSDGSVEPATGADPDTAGADRESAGAARGADRG